MKGNKVVVGVFTYLDDALKVIKEVRDADYEVKTYAPTYIHELDQAVTGMSLSPIRKITGSGAIVGIVSGFALAILCALDWPLRTSAKEIMSIPGFVVIGYECTILFGAIFTLLGLMHLCRLPALLRQVGYDPRFSDDKIGVVVGCDEAEVEKIREKMAAVGADEVQVRDGI